MERSPRSRTQAPDPAAAPAAGRGSALRVHIVEHDHAFGLELARALVARGLATRVIGRGGTAIVQAASERPDLIVLSADMPEISGYDVCSRLKREKATESIPIILTSGQADPGTFEAHQRLEFRADAYLRKPFDAGKLLQVAAMLVDVPSDPRAPGRAPVPAAPPAAPAPPTPPRADEVLEDGFVYLGGAIEPEPLDEGLVRMVGLTPAAPAPGGDVLEDGFAYLGGGIGPEVLEQGEVVVAGFDRLLEAAARTAPGRWELPAGMGIPVS